MLGHYDVGKLVTVRQLKTMLSSAALTELSTLLCCLVDACYGKRAVRSLVALATSESSNAH